MPIGWEQDVAAGALPDYASVKEYRTFDFFWRSWREHYLL